jgi:NADH-quinone oxidoreductase subunit G
VRYKQREEFVPIDTSSPSLTRDPNKCVLCGDCVRVCSEVQGIGAIDFAARGAKAKVAPAFEQNLGDVECVNCGQCAAVCPTGAIIPKQNREEVWNALHDDKKIVVAQIAPAVRVGLGEYFGLEPGINVAGQLVAALKIMGFDQVFDTSFAADMTIFEEATEFLERLNKDENMPMFTSCCPAWVKFAEIYFPELIPKISSCKSPQQMFGTVAKKVLPEQLDTKGKEIVVVSIMPCTAKKFEAQLPKFATDGKPDVDFVLTTQEIGRMINSMGIKFNELEAEAFDMPMGFATGAGVIFGASGGVMEAALRYAAEKVEGKKLKNVDFKEVRGEEGLRDAEIELGGNKLKIAVVHGLANARKLAEKVNAGKVDYHFVEVMACPGGCVAGAGQPIQQDKALRDKRTSGIFKADKSMQLHKSQENYLVEKCYNEHIGGGPGTHEAHGTLHTHYSNRCQLFDAKIPVIRGKAKSRLPVAVTICANQEDCPGQILLGMIVEFIKKNGWTDRTDVDAVFSSREQKDGTICVTVGDMNIERCHFTNAVNTEEELESAKAFAKIKQAISNYLEN